MPLAPSELATPEMVDEHVPKSYAQDMEITVLKPTLESSAIPYQKNQSVNLELWNRFFIPISLLGLDQFIDRDM